MGVGCQRRLLASGDTCRVERCSCGTLHVSLGALTLRLEPSVVVDTIATLERALVELDQTNESAPPPHDPEERERPHTIGVGEVRVINHAKFGFFVERGLWHAQLWHRTARVSVLTPSRLTGDAYEIFPSAGWKRRASSHREIMRALFEEHAIAFVSEDALREVERIFVRAPIAFAASPEGAS
jgi:hypothetical protein